MSGCGCGFGGAGFGGGGGAAAAAGVYVGEDGSLISVAPFRTLNFVGPGVTATDAGGNVANITVPGGVLDPSVGVEYFDDFLGNEISSFGVVGGGASNAFGAVLGNNRPGTVTSQVTAAGESARIQLNSNNNNTIYFGGGVVTLEIAHQIVTLSDGVNNVVVRDGTGNSPGADYSNGVYLEYDLATHGSQNYFLCAAAGGVRTKRDTGIAAVAGVTRKIILTVNALGTNLSATIDGAPSANTVTADIPVISARASQISLQTSKQLGATARQVIRDYYRFRMIFTTPR